MFEDMQFSHGLPTENKIEIMEGKVLWYAQQWLLAYRNPAATPEPYLAHVDSLASSIMQLMQLYKDYDVEKEKKVRAFSNRAGD